jgi:hypothetical protein
MCKTEDTDAELRHRSSDRLGVYLDYAATTARTVFSLRTDAGSQQWGR